MPLGLEAWRRPSSIRRTCSEIGDGPEPTSTAVEVFASCVPCSPNVQAKLHGLPRFISNGTRWRC